MHIGAIFASWLDPVLMRAFAAVAILSAVDIFSVDALGAGELTSSIAVGVRVGDRRNWPMAAELGHHKKLVRNQVSSCRALRTRGRPSS